MKKFLIGILKVFKIHCSYAIHCQAYLGLVISIHMIKHSVEFYDMRAIFSTIYMMKRWRERKTIIFDVDGTIY